MTREMFEQLLYKKAKIGVNADKNKYLSAINGKKLIILLDDINTIDEEGNFGRWLLSILAQGYYYNNITLEKIYLKKVSIIATENSCFEFNLSTELIRHFKPLYLPQLSIK